MPDDFALKRVGYGSRVGDGPAAARLAPRRLSAAGTAITWIVVASLVFAATAGAGGTDEAAPGRSLRDVAEEPRLAELMGRLAAAEADGVFDCFRDRDAGVVLDAAIEADLSGTLARVVALPAGAVRSRAVRLVAGRLATRDASAAIGFIRRVPEADRGAAAEEAYATIAGRSVDRALRAVARETDPIVLPRATLAVIRALPAADRMAAERLAAGLPDDLRTRAWRDIGGKWPLTDFPGLVAWVRGLDEAGLSAVAAEEILRDRSITLVNERPDLAIAGLRLLPADIRRDRLDLLGDRIAKRDLAAAIRWLESIPDAADRSEGLVGVIDTWAGADADAATATVARWPDRAAAPRVARILGRTLAAIDADSALERVRSLPDDCRAAALGAALARIAGDDAARARAEMLGLPPGADRDEIAVAVLPATVWAGPRRAAEFAVAYPDAAVAAVLVRAIAQEWYLRDDGADPGDREEWIAGINAAEIRAAAVDGGLAALLWRLALPKPRRDAAPLVRLVALIEDPAQRTARRAEAARAWERAFPGDVSAPFANPAP